MSDTPPRCPRKNCKRFLVRKGGRWWCARCARWVSERNADG